MMLPFRFLAALAAAALLSACTTGTAARPGISASPAKAPVTILVSIDGFRPDYLKRGVTPTLNALAASGVSARMRPAFPSKTFPNHWALVTGDYPDHNGITANKMEDPRRPDDVFTMASDDPFWWNEAEPIWVAAEKAGIRTATMFWPGSNVAWGGTRDADWPHKMHGGTRPEDWQQFNQAVSGTQRVDTVLDWLRRPAATRPAFVTLYFDTVDTAGHAYGPVDARTTRAVRDVDQKIGMLVNGLARLDQPANLVIVSDHGMAATSGDRRIALDHVADPDSYRIVETGPYATLTPARDNDAALARTLLAPHDHMRCWRKRDIPARFHYGSNRRIPPYLCLAETGWSITATSDDPVGAGNHGYDNDAPAMAALFVASGPAFASDETLPKFDNVDVYALLRRLIDLPPADAVDGSLAPLKPALARP